MHKKKLQFKLRVRPGAHPANFKWEVLKKTQSRTQERIQKILVEG